MAVEFVSTIGTTNYSFDWVAEEIIVEAGVTDVSAADLKSAIHDAQDGTEGIYRNKIATSGNPVVLTGTSSTFLNVILLDGWKINSFSSSGTLTVGEGNVVSLADGIDIFAPNALVNFVNNTSAAGVLVTGGSGVTAQDIADIKDAIFDELVQDSESFRKTVELLRQRLDMSIQKPNRYRNDGSLITNDDFTLTRTNNGTDTTVQRS